MSTARKKLLAEAGYPDGFALTLHAPNDRYVNDEQICAGHCAIAGTRRHRHQGRGHAFERLLHTRQQAGIQLHAGGLGSGYCRGVVAAKALLATFSPEKGMGTANRGRYSNAKMDEA